MISFNQIVERIMKHIPPKQQIYNIGKETVTIDRECADVIRVSDFVIHLQNKYYKLYQVYQG